MLLNNLITINSILDKLFLLFDKFKIKLLILFIIIILITLLYTIFEYIFTFKKNSKLSKIYFLIKKFIISFFNITLIVFSLFILTSLFSTFKSIQSVYQNYIKLKELKITLKNLSEEKRIAKIQIINIVNNIKSFNEINSIIDDFIMNNYNNIENKNLFNLNFSISNQEKLKNIFKNLNFPIDLIYFKLTFYSQDGQKVFVNDFLIPGNELYIDFIVLNFDYKLIEQNEKFTLALPYKIFSNIISFNNGISLFLNNNNKIPYFLDYKNNIPYSISLKNYRNTVNYILQIINNNDFAKKEGIRSYHGSALHFIPQNKDQYIIRTTATGGINLEKIYF